MKAPQTKKSITTGRLGDPDTYVVQADVDFSPAYKRSGTQPSSRTIAAFAMDLPRKSVEISPQEQAGAALTSQAAIPSGMVETDNIDSSGYTPEDFYTDIEDLIAEVHGEEAMNVLNNANVNEYGKFYYQRAYDVVDNNPSLYQYFEEYYPETLQELKDLSTKYGVVVGETPYGQPILASQEYSFAGIPSALKIKAEPFNSEAIEFVTDAKQFQTMAARAIYDVGVQAGATADWVFSPRKKGIEFLSLYGGLAGATPQKIAEWRNYWFNNDPNTTPFTPEEIKNMTFGSLLQDPATQTMSDRVINEIAKKVPELGLGVAPEGMPAESTLAAPGGIPLGEGPNALLETIVSTGIGVLTGRGAVELAKTGIRGTSKFYKDGAYDYVAAQQAINQQRNSSGGFGRFIANARQGGLDSSRNLWNTVQNEQALALASVLSVDQYQKLNLFQDNPTLQATTTLGVGLFGGILGVGLGKSLYNFSYNNIEAIAPSLFRGDYADLQEALGKQNTAFGRRTVNEIGRVLATMKQNDPDGYDSIMSTFRQFKSDADTTRTALLESGVSEVEADDLVELMTQAKSNAWALGIFGAAREHYSQFTLAGRGVLMAKSFGQSLQKNLDNLTSFKRIQEQEEAAVQAYGRTLFELTKQFRALEDSSIGAPQELRTLVLNMRNNYENMLAVPAKNAKKIGSALEDVYNIADRYNARTVTKDEALDKVNILYASMEDQEKDIFTRVLRDNLDNKENYGGFTKSLENLETVQKQIEADRTLARSVHAPLRQAGILGPADDLNVTKPDVGPMRTAQTRLLKTAYDANKRTSDNLYNEAFEEATDLSQTVSLANFGADLQNKIEIQGFTYGSDGLRVARQELASLTSANKPFGKFMRLFSLDDDAEVSLEDVEKIMEGFQDLSLKEAVQLRSEIGTRAFKLRDTNRRASAVLSDIHSILDGKINDSFSETGVVSAKLKLANDNYRDNVATLFFDRYTRAALKGETDMPIPFRQVFNRSTIRSSADGNVEAGDSPVLRRDIYERMFPEGSPLRAEADQQIKDVMQQQIFGSVPPAQMTRQEYVKRLRTAADSPNASLFFDKEDGGFLDILLGPESVADFRTSNRAAPILETDDKIGAGPTRENFTQQTAGTLAGDPFYNQQSMKANKQFIGNVVADLSKALRERQEVEFSPTAKIFDDIARSGANSADAGSALVNIITKNSGEPAKNIYSGLLEDVYKLYGNDSPEAARFEAAINKSITENLLNKVSVRYLETQQPGIEAVDFSSVDIELRQNKELYGQVFGDNYDSVVSLVKMGRLSNTVGDTIKFGQDLKEMTESAALSRFWGVARGVVSVRYVASEWLLRKLAAKNNEALIEILATPELPNYVMQAAENNVYSPVLNRTMAQRFIPALAGALSEQNNTEDYKTTLNALNDMYRESNVRKADFIENIMGLMFAARNETLRNEMLDMLQRTAQSEGPPDPSDVQRLGLSQ
jgi:hypothetical protein